MQAGFLGVGLSLVREASGVGQVQRRERLFPAEGEACAKVWRGGGYGEPPGVWSCPAGRLWGAGGCCRDAARESPVIPAPALDLTPKAVGNLPRMWFSVSAAVDQPSPLLTCANLLPQRGLRLVPWDTAAALPIRSLLQAPRGQLPLLLGGCHPLDGHSFPSCSGLPPPAWG